jgi:hypothetical protein
MAQALGRKSGLPVLVDALIRTGRRRAREK